LTEYLLQEQAALDRFIDLLQQEQAALVKGDVDALISISERKIKQAEQLNTMERERSRLLEDAGFGSNVAGWLTQQSAPTILAWERLMESARTARHLNQTNGKLIQTHLQHNKQALRALMNASNMAGAYGPDGQLRSGASSTQRSIGKV
jgi:flagella synthesis protein FlgN